jgi:CRP/FNR family cyclic AMP-dependent transcriptional regulator
LLGGAGWVESRAGRRYRTKEDAVLTQVQDLREFKIFEELNDRELETIAKIAKTEELGKGAQLTQVGHSAANLYLIKKGLVTVMTPGPEGRDLPVDEVGPGQIVGWSTLTGPYLYTATTVTAEKATLIVVNGNKLRQVFEINNHIGYRVLKGIGYVVARRMAAIEAKCATSCGE